MDVFREKGMQENEKSQPSNTQQTVEGESQHKTPEHAEEQTEVGCHIPFMRTATVDINRQYYAQQEYVAENIHTYVSIPARRISSSSKLARHLAGMRVY
jgi:hypothetical protein